MIHYRVASGLSPHLDFVACRALDYQLSRLSPRERIDVLDGRSTRVIEAVTCDRCRKTDHYYYAKTQH